MDRNSLRWWAATFVAVVVVAWAAAQCRRTTGPAPARPPQASQPVGPIRQAAVAGLFYPRDPNTLSATLDALLAAAHPPALENVRALVCPHAGYEFSGPTAAFSYKLLAGRKVRTVIVMGPSHYAELIGAYIPLVGGYATPLGTVRISPKAAVLAKAKCFSEAGPYRVYRPAWWRESSADASGLRGRHARHVGTLR